MLQCHGQTKLQTRLSKIYLADKCTAQRNTPLHISKHTLFLNSFYHTRRDIGTYFT